MRLHWGNVLLPHPLPQPPLRAPPAPVHGMQESQHKVPSGPGEQGEARCKTARFLPA